MLNNLTGWHFLIILVVILLLFGAPKLPALARSLGQSMKILRNEVKSDDPTDPAAEAGGSAPAAEVPKTTGSTESTTKS
ncbi:twin-arginine translocase TatA/TatE family subunit [Luethyella okanaganae]|uniref:Sec-independent protein translocase protein TatA n=1 Tax=Luethyella okanaganae TaxID=69372 RepID=A0ABW1VCI6_9MICO